ncbi:MAG TPA: permease prefix domain 1-containing protein, partial [Thermoanaerobaculia bacterium]|nr:permease prefix domain 1-containing protein [Thermoanaerobaculia bacterium]
MRSARAWLRTLRNVALPRRFERELDAELASAVEELAAEEIARGVPPAEARRRARVKLGGVESLKEAVRDARGAAWVEALAQDGRFALRTLRRAKGYSLV